MRAPFLERYAQAMRDLYPETERRLAAGEFALSPTLLSPNVVPVSAATIASAKRIARAFHALRESPAYVEFVCALGPYAVDPGNRGALTSLDFHVGPDGALKLIEINTNASMGLMGDLAYRAQGLANPLGGDFRDELLATFRAEARASRIGRDPARVAIVDRAPDKQRLFVEFLACQELFRGAGMACEIADTSEVQVDLSGRAAIRGEQIDLIYNRDVDFYLSAPESAGLRRAFTEGAACVTPQPFEYQALADKDRLGELAEPGALERFLPDDADARDAIRGCLLRSRPVASFDPEELWRERRNWFFKPARAHGGKAAYRGASIARKAFGAMIESGGFIAQEYAPPATIEAPEGELKYDLRFFVYRGRAQMGVARLYQGQTTNAQTPGGGTACLREYQ